MSAPEDRLRQILLAEAEDIIPAGDGLQQIQERLAHRRSLRSKLVPAVAVGGVLAVAAAAALVVSLTDDGSLTQPEQRARDTRPSPVQTPPSPFTPTPTLTTSAPGIPVWPFTTDAQAADWAARPAARPWATDPVQVTQHLLDDYLNVPGRATSRVDADPDAAVVEVSAGGRPVSQVRLVRVGTGTDGPWSVTGATSDNLSVTQPADGDEVHSPLAITGRASDPDTSVHLRLIADRVLGEGYAMAGRDRPWTHSLSWSGTTWSVGALVANTFDGKGDLRAVTLTAVRRSVATTPKPPAAGTVFVAVDQERIVSVDARTGQRLRQLSYPPTGVTDLNPDMGGGDVVWVRIQPDSCTSTIIRAGVTGGAAGVAVEAKHIGRKLPSLSASGSKLGWVEQECGGDAIHVVVRGADGGSVMTVPTSEGVKDLDVRDDGYAVVWTVSGVYVVPPGAGALTPDMQLRADGCTLAAPAWDGTAVIAWQLCGASWRLGRWTETGALLSSSGDVPDMSAPLHTAVTSGQVLVSFDDYRIPRLTDGRLVDTPNALRWKQADW